MGTRGLIGYYKGGKTKGTFNHWDSYPSELGNRIKKYIAVRSIEQLNGDHEGITLLKGDDVPEYDQVYSIFGHGDFHGSTETTDKWIPLLEEASGDLSAYAEIGIMADSESFLQDSLFCEWAYIVNLDLNVLEIYRGFQTKPCKNRYAMSKEQIAEIKADLKKKGKGDWINVMDNRTGKVKERYFCKNNPYYNCALFTVIPFDLIQSFDMDLYNKFTNDLEGYRSAILSKYDLSPEMVRSYILPTVMQMLGITEDQDTTLDQGEHYSYGAENETITSPAELRSETTSHFADYYIQRFYKEVMESAEVEKEHIKFLVFSPQRSGVESAPC